jgi:hypothetical protein
LEGSFEAEMSVSAVEVSVVLLNNDIDHVYCKLSVDLEPSHAATYAAAVNCRLVLAVVENAGPPTMLAYGTIMFNTLTDPEPKLQEPKKLHNSIVNAYWHPFCSKLLLIETGDLAPAAESTDKYEEMTDTLLALLVTVILTVVQARPPLPVDPPKSMVSESHDPMVDGNVNTATGFTGDDGVNTATVVLATVGHP